MRTVSWAIVVAVAALSACGARSRLADSSDGGRDGAAAAPGDGSSGGQSDGGGDDGAAASSSSGGSSGGSSGSSSGAGDCPPVINRTSDYECVHPPVPPTGDCNYNGTPQPGKCLADVDCAGAGPNARCTHDGHGFTSCVCSFDTCSGDPACPAGQTCACHGDQYMKSLGNTCVPSNCRTGADCGPGGQCSPTLLGGCGGIGGYYCHTPSDECRTDCECAMVDATKYCGYDPAVGHWACRTLQPCN